MKNFLSIVFILFSIQCFSQDFKITGKLVDQEGAVIESATIYTEKVADSSLISYTISDRHGNFSLSGNTNSAKLNLFISFTGYELFNRTLDVKEQMLLDTLVLKVQDNLLDEVKVIAARSPISIRKDTLEFNADSFKTRPNANLEELLKVLPGVEVDREGNITLNGKPVRRILVDGDSFFGGDHRIATKNLPREIIDKIQVVDTKTKTQEFTGQPGDKENKTINVTIKKDKKKGYFARATAGGGTDERYELNAMANLFTENIQANVIGNSNNINSPGFTFAQDVLGSRIPIGSSNGITKADNAGATVRYKWDNMRNINADYFFGRNDTEGRTIIARENILPDSRYFTNSEENSNRINDNHRFSTGWGHVFGRNHISVSPKFTGNYGNSFRSSKEESLDEDGNLINTTETFGNAQSTDQNFSNTISLSRRLGEEGSRKSMVMALSHDHTRKEMDNFFNSESLFFGEDEPETQIQDQYITQKETDNRYSFKISRNSYLSEKWFLGVHYDIGHSYSTNQRLVYEGESGEDYDQLNTLLSDDFEIKNITHKPHAGVNYISFKWSFNAQLGFMHTKLQSENFLKQTSLENSFNNFYASGFLRHNYSTSASKYIQIRYGSNVSIPTIQQMQPVVDRTNPLNIIQGNPELQPIFNQSINLEYYNFVFPGFNGWHASGGLNLTDNSVVPVTTVNENLVRTTTYTNVDGVMSANAAIGYQNSFGKDVQKFKYKSSVGNRYNRNVGFLNGVKYNSGHYSLTPSVGIDYSIEEILSIIPNYQLTYNSFSYDINQVRNRNFTNHKIGLQAVSYWPKNVVFNNDLSWNYYGDVSPGLENSSLLWSLSLGYQFLADKATLNLNIYDLLNQNIETRRMIGDDYIQDINSLILRRYFMLSFTYKLGNFGGGSGQGGSFQVISM